MPKRVPSARPVRGLLDLYIRRALRRWGLPEIPEVGLLLRAACQKSFTFGAAPSPQKMRAIREEALTAVIHDLPDDSGI